MSFPSLTSSTSRNEDDHWQAGSFVFFSGFPGGSDGKESTCNAGDPGFIPGLGRSPGEGNDYTLQYFCLENPMDRGAWRATVHGVAKNQTRLNNTLGSVLYRKYYSLLCRWYLVPNSSVFFSGWSQQRAGDDSTSPHHYICFCWKSTSVQSVEDIKEELE